MTTKKVDSTIEGVERLPSDVGSQLETKQAARAVLPTPKPKKTKAERKKVEEDVAKAQKWGNIVQFILTAVRLAFGLGNVWKFPYLAYKHGGAAFIIPYFIFGLTFGLPAIYCEFLMGQHSRANSALTYYRYAPAFQGIGLFTAILCFTIGTFYALVIAWTELYLAFVIGGQSWRWTQCGNSWNSDSCISTQDYINCRTANPSTPFRTINNTCSDVPDKGTKNAATEFFFNYALHPSAGMTMFGEFNWPVMGCVIVFYALCALTLWKGIRILEKTSYFTVPLPYIVVLIFFFRVFWLDGSWDGIKRYLFEPNWGHLFTVWPWIDALKQLCFSLTLGGGALVSLASHNKPSNNCFRDAYLVVIFDTLMSVIGGVAVFGTIGYLAKTTGIPFNNVVTDGPALVFITYPEASSSMPVAWLWDLLFFLMIFLLGFSTMVVLIEFVSSLILTSFPQLGKSKKWTIIVPYLLCASLALTGCMLATGMGAYWLAMLLAEHVVTTEPCLAVTLEIILLAHVYRYGNVKEDMAEMWGPPPENLFCRWISRFSPYFKWSWFLIAPILGTAGVALTLWHVKYPAEIAPDVPFLVWAEVIGWILNLGPTFAVPIWALVNYFRYRQKGIASISQCPPNGCPLMIDITRRRTSRRPTAGPRAIKAPPPSSLKAYSP